MVLVAYTVFVGLCAASVGFAAWTLTTVLSRTNGPDSSGRRCGKAEVWRRDPVVSMLGADAARQMSEAGRRDVSTAEALEALCMSGGRVVAATSLGAAVSELLCENGTAVQLWNVSGAAGDDLVGATFDRWEFDTDRAAIFGTDRSNHPLQLSAGTAELVPDSNIYGRRQRTGR